MNIDKAVQFLLEQQAGANARLLEATSRIGLLRKGQARTEPHPQALTRLVEAGMKIVARHDGKRAA